MSRFLAILIVLFVSNIAAALAPPPDRDTPSCTLKLEIDGAITPATLDYIERGSKQAAQMNCRSILLLINSGGGALTTTRTIVEKILASPIPFLCLVSPSGGHAGSAAAIIALACHVNGAEPATNIGAATPIGFTGETLSEDLRKKIIEDTVSWVTGLARLRGRDVDFAQKIVTEAKAYDAEEAVAKKALDTLALDPARFLDFAEGREVAMSGGAKATVATGAVTAYQTDLRHDFLSIITDPEIAYLLFMASLALLYFEFSHPGAIAPGVAGSLGLIASLIAFNRLDVHWGGVALIALGLGFLVAEAFVPSFGALGIGGILALTGGSLILYEPGSFSLPLPMILATSGSLGALMLALAVVAFRTRKKGKASAELALIGRVGEVMSLEAPSLRRGMVQVAGENWRFVCAKDVRVGEMVRVLSQEGLTLRVEPKL